MNFNDEYLTMAVWYNCEPFYIVLHQRTNENGFIIQEEIARFTVEEDAINFCNDKNEGTLNW